MTTVGKELESMYVVSTLAVTNHGNYHLVTGTIAEVSAELTRRNVRTRNVTYMKSDGTEAIYSK